MNDRLVGSIAIVCSIGGSLYLYSLFKAPMTQTMRRAEIKLEKVVFCRLLLPGGRPVLAPERDGALARLPHDAPARDQPAEALAVGEGVARADGASGAATREWARQSLLGAGPRAPLHQLGLNKEGTFNAEKNNHQILAGNRASMGGYSSFSCKGGGWKIFTENYCFRSFFILK